MYSLIVSNSVPVIRLVGAISSGLVCVHSLSFLMLGTTDKHSFLRFVHNIADIVVFLGFGVCGIVVELFPRDSVTYTMLKANFPFLINMVGRGIFYIILGCLVMGDYGTEKVRLSSISGLTDEEHDSFWEYFTICSGIFIALTGLSQLYVAIRSRTTRSLQTAELAQPIVAFVPTIIERAPRQVEVVLPDPV
jgi:hypothetical protein